MPPSPVQITNYVATGLSQLTSQFQKPRPDTTDPLALSTEAGADLLLENGDTLEAG